MHLKHLRIQTIMKTTRNFGKMGRLAQPWSLMRSWGWLMLGMMVVLGCREKEEFDVCDRSSFYGTWSVGETQRTFRSGELSEQFIWTYELTFTSADTVTFPTFGGQVAEWYVQPDPARIIFSFIWYPVDPNDPPFHNIESFEITECSRDRREMIMNSSSSYLENTSYETTYLMVRKE